MLQMKNKLLQRRDHLRRRLAQKLAKARGETPPPDLPAPEPGWPRRPVGERTPSSVGTPDEPGSRGRPGDDYGSGYGADYGGREDGGDGFGRGGYEEASEDYGPRRGGYGARGRGRGEPPSGYGGGYGRDRGGYTGGGGGYNGDDPYDPTEMEGGEGGEEAWAGYGQSYDEWDEYADQGGHGQEQGGDDWQEAGYAARQHGGYRYGRASGGHRGDDSHAVIDYGHQNALEVVSKFEEVTQRATPPEEHGWEPEYPTVSIADLLRPPGRLTRPTNLVIVLRGPPGSGKTYTAKLIKDQEVANKGSAPRILSLDDYFCTEKEKAVRDPVTGRSVTKKISYANCS
ncbi:TATA-binding protein-associated factor 2N-like [Pollicipes pollicipes]|uniref:TATA-binding protein-associated factor 2N-like n=1 Tax=Pollicipes pollicipes TaxID=41117 RepID=UPI0018854237|nr:TATA-binding protein-associated factor 2N-like [Pollicipes pollicipes]